MFYPVILCDLCGKGFKPVPSMQETVFAAKPETPQSTPAPLHASRSKSAPTSPAHPTPRHTTPEESPPPASTPHPLPSSRSAKATAQTTPTRARPRKLRCVHKRHGADSPETSTPRH